MKSLVNKKLSIFDLKEGKTYAAFDGTRRLGKNYRVASGKLQNASTDGDPNDLTIYEGCSWIPLKATITFQELKGVKVVKAVQNVSVLGLKQGIIYKPSAQIHGFVARKGRNLILVDEKGKNMGNVDLEIVQLSTMFSEVGKIKGSKTVSSRR